MQAAETDIRGNPRSVPIYQKGKKQNKKKQHKTTGKLILSITSRVTKAIYIAKWGTSPLRNATVKKWQNPQRLLNKGLTNQVYDLDRSGSNGEEKKNGRENRAEKT